MKMQSDTFRGISPKIANDKLAPDMGQIVQDAKTSSGDLAAIKRSVGEVELTGASYKTFFEYLEGVNSHWAFFDTIVHWARSPVADDTYERTYFTGGPAVTGPPAIAAGAYRAYANDLVSTPFDRSVGRSFCSKSLISKLTSSMATVRQSRRFIAP